MSRVSSHYHLQYLPHFRVWRLPLQISSLVLWPFLSAILFVIHPDKMHRMEIFKPFPWPQLG
jgi:hypothetical protein